MLPVANHRPKTKSLPQRGSAGRRGYRCHAGDAGRAGHVSSLGGWCRSLSVACARSVRRVRRRRYCDSNPGCRYRGGPAAGRRGAACQRCGRESWWAKPEPRWPMPKIFRRNSALLMRRPVSSHPLRSMPPSARILTWRDRGEKVGFTNGCFDLLHPGHVSLLSQARASLRPVGGWPEF